MTEMQTFDGIPTEEPRNVLDYDPFYAGLTSFVFHFLFFLITCLIAFVAIPRDFSSAPAVDVVAVADVPSSGGQSMDDPAGDGLQPTSDRPPTNAPQPDKPSEKIEEVKQEVPDKIVPNAEGEQKRQELVDKTSNAAATATAAAKAAAQKSLNPNLGGSAPSGGGTGTGRAGRAARWILHFQFSSPADHLSQMGSLGAAIAFPLRGDKYQYFTNLDGSPKSETRELSSEKRIYWMDDNRDSFGPLAAHLRVSPPPPLMIAFLPTELEDKMLRLEKSYNGVNNEDQILQTVFQCIRTGGGYDVQVIKQTTR